MNLYQAHIGLTTRCNLNCSHCYSRNERERYCEIDIELDDLERIFKKLKKLQTFKVIFAYAESLLYKDFFNALLMAKKYGFDIEITSNSILLSANVIAKIKDCGVDKIQLSLDYPDIRHDVFRDYQGLFNRVKEALLQLKIIGGFRVKILSTRLSDDLEFYKKFQEIADEYGIDVVAFLSSEKVSCKSKEDIEKVITLLSRDERFSFHSPYLTPDKCFVGKIMHINPKGDFTLCPLSSKIVGNIFDIDDIKLSEIYKQSKKLACIL
ncbi:MAG: radical SAM protein [Bdellovibrionota bacterium]|nr:radical SAM protein [Bdellovibrionota bacterium]